MPLSRGRVTSGDRDLASNERKSNKTHAAFLAPQGEQGLAAAGAGYSGRDAGTPIAAEAATEVGDTPTNRDRPIEHPRPYSATLNVRNRLFMERDIPEPAPASTLHFLLNPDASTEQNRNGFGSTDQRGGPGGRAGRGRRPAEPILDVKAGGKTVARIWRSFPDGTDGRVGCTGRQASDERRLEKLCEWRRLANGLRGRARAGENAVSPPASDVEARRAALDMCEALAARTREAEAACCGQIRALTGLAEDTRIEPLWHTTAFTARDCLRCPVTEQTRHWFRLLTELHYVEAAVAKAADPRTECSWAATVHEIRRTGESFAMVDLAWGMHVQLVRDTARGTRVDDSVDWLAAWSASEVGERYLLPLLERHQPGAGREELRRQLLLEMWASVLALRPAKLSVAEFHALPKAAAAAVRKSYPDAEDEVGSLQPASQRRLADLGVRFPDPQESLLDRDESSRGQILLRTLPPHQRRAIELCAEGLTYEEIAAELGCGFESAKTHLARARKALRARSGPGIE